MIFIAAQVVMCLIYDSSSVLLTEGLEVSTATCKIRVCVQYDKVLLLNEWCTCDVFVDLWPFD